HRGRARSRAGDGRCRSRRRMTESGEGPSGEMDPDVDVAPASESVAVQEALEAPAESLSEYLSRWWLKVRAGDLGSLPIVVGLVIIAVVFGVLNDNFFGERNFTNLLLQMAAVSTMAIGIVFVL